MMRPTWINDLNGLIVRFSYLGITNDVGTMSIIELWGVYCYLKRIAES
jgi:hypothetical protein